MSATTITNPVIRIFQFIAAAFGCGEAGKKGNTNARVKKHSAMVLIARPARPRLNLDGRRVSPIIRFLAMQAIATMYEATVPT
jgi:hypothetical protein